MARAKRTDRAEARRRHRASTLAETAATEEGASTPDAAGETGAATAPGQRPQGGIRYALTSSFRPLDLRGDLQSLPWLIRTRAMAIPLALVVIASVVWVIAERSLPPVGETTQTQASPLVLVAFFGFQYFVMTPPIGGAFLGGFMAPRASWLIGWIVGLAAAIAIAVIASVSPSAIDRVVGTTDATRGAYVVNALLASPVFSALFAAAAAWYKRFLDLANPNRRRSANASSSSRPKRRSGNQRPLLSRAAARRR